MITLRDISKMVQDGNQKRQILDGIQLSIQTGEFVAIVGPSGSGKSTLLNILGLLDRPSTGSYQLAGQEVVKLSGRKLAALRNTRIGFVFQSFMLLPRLCIQENVELPMLYSHLGRKERKLRARQALEQVHLYDRRKANVTKISGGERQRVAIARALVNHPDLILADEPTGNLDEKSKNDILQIFQRLNREGKTVLMVTHDMEAAQVADKILRIHGGRITAETTTASSQVAPAGLHGMRLNTAEMAAGLTETSSE